MKSINDQIQANKKNRRSILDQSVFTILDKLTSKKTKNNYYNKIKTNKNNNNIDSSINNSNIKTRDVSLEDNINSNNNLELNYVENDLKQSNIQYYNNNSNLLELLFDIKRKEYSNDKGEKYII